jgi:hypothetical protein
MVIAAQANERPLFYLNSNPDLPVQPAAIPKAARRRLVDDP